MITVIAALGIVLVTILYLYLDSKTNPKSKTDKPLPPGPPRKKIIGNLDFMAKYEGNMVTVTEEATKLYGDMVFISIGTASLCIVANMDAVDEVTKNSKAFTNAGQFRDSFGKLFPKSVIILEGDEWKVIRKLIQDSLKRQKSSNLFDQVSATAKSVLQKFDESPKDKDNIIAAQDFLPLISSLLFDAFGKFGFGHNFETLQGKNATLLQDANVVWLGSSKWSQMPFDILRRIPTQYNRNVWASTNRLKKVSIEIITKRMEELKNKKVDSEGEDNLLNALIRAQDETTGGKLSMDEIVDNIVSLFFAAYETTANTICFIMHYLSHNLEAQEELAREADAILGTGDDESLDVTLEKVEKLKFCDQVCKEAMRLLPVAPHTPRQAIQDIEIGGYFIPKGCVLICSTYSTGRDYKAWNTTPEEILQFNPHRWDNVTAKQQKLYFPFGFGQRMCPGFRVAGWEMKTLIAMICRSYRVLPDKKFNTTCTLTITPKGGAYFKLQKRH